MSVGVPSIPDAVAKGREALGTAIQLQASKELVFAPSSFSLGTWGWKGRWKPMLDTLTSISATTLMVIIGPIVLGLALAYGVIVAGRRRKLSPLENARRDDATRRLQQ